MRAVLLLLLGFSLSAPGLRAAPPENGKPDSSDADSSESEAPAPRDPLEGSRSPKAAQADVIPDRSGFAIALRTGWGIPQGKLDAGLDLGDEVGGMVPIWLDLGYRLTETLLLGVYAHYAFALPRICPESGTCNASDVRFGFQAQWHFGVRDTIDHWVGVGAGFEIYDEDIAGATRRLGGVEFANLQFGEDLSLGHRFGLGPFLSVSIGKFTSLQQGAPGEPTVESRVPATALHSWVVIGLRLSFGA
jgi:hypothetical protein